MKRLAKDQVNLRKSLPPNYFFEIIEDGQSLPDDLTQLTISLTGPEGTPYSQGAWTLSLNIPTEYPQNPPTATFKTRIFHPNVAEQTGAVCLETLKRDWDPKLTLKDILVTISCLLIQPNPDSALNQKAGALIQEDYEAFARQARLMTRIHASIPHHLQEAAREARGRGEERDADNFQKSTIPLSSHTSTEESGKQNVLKENQPSQNSDTNQLSTEKPTKRSLTDVSETADSPQQEQDVDTRRRKSPKHHHVPEGPTVPSIETVEPPELKSQETKAGRHKVVFRAQWSKAPAIKFVARIGIRRL